MPNPWQYIFHFWAKFSHRICVSWQLTAWIFVLSVLNDNSQNLAYFLRPYMSELSKLSNPKYTKIAFNISRVFWYGLYIWLIPKNNLKYRASCKVIIGKLVFPLMHYCTTIISYAKIKGPVWFALRGSILRAGQQWRFESWCF